MALTGSHPRSLDDKKRLAIPRQLYEEFEDKKLESFYVAPETARSTTEQHRFLSLFSPAGYDRQLRKLEEQSKEFDELSKRKRLYCSQAAKVGLDAQSRIRIPERLAEFAGLQRDVILIGASDHAEIWDAALWEHYFKLG